MNLNNYIIRDFNKSLSTDKKKCYSCIHRRSVPGSAHSSCAKTNALTNFEEHGIKSGWAVWPIDFDPTWLNFCDSYMPKEIVFSDNFEELAVESYAWLKYVQQKAYKTQNMSLFIKLKEIVDKDLSGDLMKIDTEENRERIKGIIIKTRKL